MEHNDLIALVGVVAVVALVAAVAVGLGTAGADSPQASLDDRTITVSATGTADTAPDQAVIRVAVTADGDDPSAVRDELAVGADDLRAALDELDVEYETSDFSVRENRHSREPEADEPAYRGVHAFEVVADDPDDAGPVIDAAASSGARVGDVELTLADETRETLREEAIGNAMDDATMQAETIANTSDLAVTGVATVDATQRNFSPVRYDLRTESGDGAGPPTEISSGDVSVTYNVAVTFNATG